MQGSNGHPKLMPELSSKDRDGARWGADACTSCVTHMHGFIRLAVWGIYVWPPPGSAAADVLPASPNLPKIRKWKIIRPRRGSLSPYLYRA